MNLDNDRLNELLEEATNDLIGHIAMESVTSYIVNSINEKYDTTFEDALELVEFLQEKNVEIVECPICGWYVEYLTNAIDEDGEYIDEEMCEDCARYY